MSHASTRLVLAATLFATTLAAIQSCKPKSAQAAAGGNAQKSYVAPGKYDEFYNIVPVDLMAK
jgi:nitrous-oxide reductase